MTAPEPDEGHSVWVTCEPQDSGGYAPTLALTPDQAVTLDEATAASYALAVLDAVQAAEYDAAVLAQLRTALGMDTASAAGFIAGQLRSRRAPLRGTGTPLRLDPGVSQRDRRGFLGVAIDGRPAGQWELADARDHALGVLEVVVAARYDTAYYEALTGAVGLGDEIARAVVADLGRYRPGGDEP